MYHQGIIVLLVVALLNVEANVIEPQRCNGGFCLPMHLCPTGIANDELKLSQNRLPMMRVDGENECGDFMKICCKESSRNSRATDSKCGISNPQGLVYNEESSITNFAKFAEFPWTVAIIQLSSFKYIPDLTIVASGTLIYPKFVLTTAHTLKSSRRYLARFGEWNLNSSAEIYPRQDIHIERHIIHPSYRDEFIPEYDVALAVLRENIIYTEHIRPLCLPSAEDLFEGQRCIETGWGYETTSDTQATIMKRLKLEIISHERCQEFFDTLDDNFELSRSVMCVEGSKSENTCMKDAGAPLACQRQDGSYVLAGMTSWMLGCHRLDAPSGHVNVTKVVGWINDTIEAYK